MRAFVAIELPAALASAIGERLAVLHSELPPARWVAPRNLHLTLAFLGQVSPSQAADLGARLRAVHSAATRFELKIQGAGAFPPRGAARVLWLGMSLPQALTRLERGVAGAVAAAGLAPPGPRRPFRPHLTVARCKRPWSRGAVERWRRAWEGVAAERFAVAGTTLFESRLGPGGPRYRAVERFALPSAAGGEAP